MAADVALRLGIAKPWEVAAALQACWDARERGGASFPKELARIACLAPEAVARMEAEVEQVLAEAGGDARKALSRRGGLDLSFPRASPAAASSASGEGPRLRTVPEGRYLDFVPAGEGGMGIVYWAIDSELNRQVAFKIIRPDGGGGGTDGTPPEPIHASPPSLDTPASRAFEALRTRFLLEAWVTGGLEHPGVVPVYEMGQTLEKIPYYTMRFVRGKRTLHTALDEVRGKGIEQRLHLLEPFLKVCDTIGYAHSRGVIHRDLKPQNIALGEFGEVVVLDWGLAKLKGGPDLAGSRWQERIQEYRSAADLNTALGVMGTPGYISPEAALGTMGEVDERSDVYSLGALLFQVLTGRLPLIFETFGEFFRAIAKDEAPSADVVDAHVPHVLASLCARALSRSKDSRQQSAKDLADAIRAWQTQDAVERQIEAWLSAGKSAVADAEGTSGEERLRHLDRAAAAYTRVLETANGESRGTDGIEVIRRLREVGMRERERGMRRSALRRAGIAAVILLATGSVVVAALLDARRREADDARAREASEHAPAESMLRRARILDLVGASAEAEATDPMRALLLAREAARAAEAPSEPVMSRLHASIGASRERAVLREPGLWFTSAIPSPAGDQVLTASRDGIARLWSSDGKQIAVLRGHEASISVALFSPSGRMILTASDDGTARLWDLSGREICVLRGHEGRILSAHFSSSGDRILTASDDKTARVWDLTGKELAVLRGHEAAVTSVLISPAGDRMLTLSDDKSARLWDERGKQLAVIGGGRSRVHLAIFSPVGDRILTVSWTPVKDKTEEEVEAAQLWDLTGKEVAVLKGHEGGIQSAVYSPSGDRILTGSRDRTARLWNAEGVELAKLEGHGGDVISAVFSPAGDEVLTTCVDGMLRTWDNRPDASTHPAVPVAVPNRPILSATFSNRGDRVLVRSLDAVAVWDMESREIVEIREPDAPILSAALSRAGDQVLTVTARAVRLWEVDHREELAVMRGHQGPILSASFSAEGDKVLTVAGDGTARVWDLAGRQTGTMGGQGERILSAVFSRKGDRILTRSEDGTARICDLLGQGIAVLHQSQEWSLPTVISPAGDHFLIVSLDHTARLLDPAGHEVAVLRGHTGPISEALFSPVGDRLLTFSEDETARLWNLEGKEIAVFRSRDGRITSAEFSPDGGHVLIGTESEDTSWHALDLAGRPSATLGGHGREVFAAFFSSGGKGILAADREDSLRLVDLSGKEMAQLRGRKGELAPPPPDNRGNDGSVNPTRFFFPERGVLTTPPRMSPRFWDLKLGRISGLRGQVGAILSAELSPAEDSLLTASEDNAAEVWDLTGRLLVVLRGHSRGVSTAVFSPAGDKILTGSRDGTARLWLVRLDDLLRVADSRITRDFTPEERERYADLLGEGLAGPKK